MNMASVSSTDRERELYKRAIDAWGVDAQVEMVVEECSELILAIQKSKRGQGIKEIVDELVDVQVMVDQMKIILEQDNRINDFEHVWNTTWKYKIDRLEKRLGDTE